MILKRLCRLIVITGIVIMPNMMRIQKLFLKVISLREFLKRFLSKQKESCTYVWLFFFCDKSIKFIYIIYKNKTSRRLRKVENMIKKRNIVLAVVLSIITCGLYGIYWFICLNNDANALTPDDSYTTSGGMAFLFTLITCGIYSWYWAYRMGAKVDKLKNGGSHTILFIVLQIFGLGIVNYCILQDTVNDYAED